MLYIIIVFLSVGDIFPPFGDVIIMLGHVMSLK